MKVLLIQPSAIVSDRCADKIDPFLPVGLGSLAATLWNSTHLVKILDAMNEGWMSRGRVGDGLIEIGISEEEIAWQVRRLQPQIVGFSIPFTTQMPRLRSLGRWVKAIHPEIMVVCGGSHPSLNPEEVASNPDIDLVFLGESELTFKVFLDRVENGSDLTDLDGIAYRNASGKVCVNPRQESDIGIDDLPWATYDQLPLKKYFRSVGRRRVPLFFSRGCANSCSYCANRRLFGKKVRYFSVDYCIEQMRYLVEYYGVKEFLFYDDNLFTEGEYAHAVFNQLLMQNFKVQWQASGGNEPSNLDDGLLNKMRRSGGKRLHFAVDSGSRKVLKHILQKSLDLHQLERAILRVIKSGIKVSCHFTLGNPGETLEEVYDTLNFAWKLRKHGVDGFSFSLATPFPGTDLFSKAQHIGSVIDCAEPLLTPYDGCLSSADVPAAEIVKIRDTAEREFNSRGLLMNLANRSAASRREIKPIEERYFTSMAPQPRYVEKHVIPDEQIAAMEDTV